MFVGFRDNIFDKINGLLNQHRIYRGTKNNPDPVPVRAIANVSCYSLHTLVMAIGTYIQFLIK